MQQNEEFVFYTFEELAIILRMSVTTLRNRHSQSPTSLPFSIVTPGSRRRLFPKSSVMEWLGLACAIPFELHSNVLIKKKGRPTKIEQQRRKVEL